MRTNFIVAVITALFTGSGSFAQMDDHSKKLAHDLMYACSSIKSNKIQ